MGKLLQSGWGECFSVISGVLFTLAFAPFNFSILIFISLAFFKFLLIGCSLRQAVLRGFLFGIGVFGLGVSWVFVSMTVHQQSYVLPLAMTILYCCFWAIFPSVVAYFFIKFQSSHFTDGVIFSCIWVCIEYIRGEYILGGFPWLQASYSQLDTPIASYIPIVGAYGGSFIVVIISSFLADFLMAKQHRKVYLISVTFIFVSLITLGIKLQNINWTHNSGYLFKATLIQGNVAQKDKWVIKNRNIILKQYYDDSLEHWDSDIIIWPETAIPAYYSDIKKEYLEPLQQEAIQNNVDIIVSLPHRDKLDKLYNSVLTLGEDSRFYNKIHLLPFGEYLPWQPISGYILGLMNIRLGQFSSGDVNQSLLKAAGYYFSTSICYEDAFGEQNIRHIEQAKFLVNVTNDGWFDDSIEPYQHMQIARMRALESGRYLLRATNTGVTVIVSEKGEIINQAPIRKRYAISSDIQPMSGLTPYAKIGDKSIIMFIVSIFFAIRVYVFLAKR